jgi:hypothetical protein
MSSGAPGAWGLSSALNAPASDRAEGLLRDLLLDSEVDWQIRPRRLLTSPMLGVASCIATFPAPAPGILGDTGFSEAREDS